MDPTNVLPSTVLTVLQAQLSALAEKIEQKLSHLDLRVCKLACRVHELEEELVGTNNTRSSLQHMNSRKRKRYHEVLTNIPIHILELPPAYRSILLQPNVYISSLEASP